MRPTNVFKVSFTVLFIGWSCAIFTQQPFIAGQITNTISYWNIEPDTVITIEPVTGNYSSSAEFEVDVDQDGTNDFEITVYESVGYSYDLKALIWGFDQNEVFIGFYDTLFPAGTNPFDTTYFPVVNPFHPGDTIPGNIFSSTEISYMCNLHASNHLWGQNLTWEDIGEKYVGFKLIKPDEEILGWLKLSVENFQGGGNPRVTVCDYAVNKPGLTNIKHRTNAKNLMIYPSPASTHLYLKLAKYNKSIVRFFNYSGKQIHRHFISERETLINLSTWPPGLYLAVMYEEGKPVEKTKFVVDR